MRPPSSPRQRECDGNGERNWDRLTRAAGGGDPDATDATVVAQTTAGTYGSFTINAAGVWSYTTTDALDQLNNGQVVTESFTVATTDGGSNTVTVNITGSQDVSTLTSATANLTETNAILTTGGTLVVSDPDATDATVGAQSTAGTYGSCTIKAAGVWSYTTTDALDQLNNGQVVTESFTVATTDGGSNTVTVNITGSQDVSTLTSATANLTETNAILTTGGTLVVSDPDATDATVVAQTTAGTYGSFTINAAGVWSYTTTDALDQLNNGQVVTASDGTLSASRSVAITVQNANEAPVVTSPLSATVVENATGIAYQAAATDPDAGRNAALCALRYRCGTLHDQCGDGRGLLRHRTELRGACRCRSQQRLRPGGDGFRRHPQRLAQRGDHGPEHQ